MTRHPELDLAERAARDAATLLREEYAGDVGIRSLSGRDIKTRADVAAEQQIVKQLAVTGIPILAEESATSASPCAGLRWLVDPLDGTMNFSRGFPACAVSIGLWEDSEPVLGVVVDVVRGTVFRGLVGAGAWRDDAPMRVSDVSDRAQAVLATGFPTSRDYSHEALASFVSRIQTFKKVRMVGSAAVSLACVAQGVFDAYMEDDIMLWDVGAGAALVLAAGGRIAIRPGRSPFAICLRAWNGQAAP